MVKRMPIKEGLDKVGQEGCDGNQSNAIKSEDIQIAVFADSRDVYQQGEVYNGTKRRCRTLKERGNAYQLKILFEKRKKFKDEKKM